jgi:hypothetical protein
MSVYNRGIKEGIQRLAGTWGKDYVSIIEAEVISVDETTRTAIAKPLSGDYNANIIINLLANPNDGFILIPSVASTVIVAMTNKNDYFVVQFSDIDKVRITIGQFEILMTENELLLGDGSLDGLVKISDLVTKLNNIENRLNIIGTWAATVTPPLTVTPLTPTIKADLENTKIKQGI